jgi:hypothetical protein
MRRCRLAPVLVDDCHVLYQLCEAHKLERRQRFICADFGGRDARNDPCFAVRIFVCLLRAYVCMYVLMHVCLYVCMYVCMYVYLINGMISFSAATREWTHCTCIQPSVQPVSSDAVLEHESQLGIAVRDVGVLRGGREQSSVRQASSICLRALFGCRIRTACAIKARSAAYAGMSTCPQSTNNDSLGSSQEHANPAPHDPHSGPS